MSGGVTVKVNVVLSERIRRGIEQAPAIVEEEVRSGMREAVDITIAHVRQSIRDKGLFQTGRMWRSVRGRVSKGGNVRTIKGVVWVGVRGRGGGHQAPILERGGTILPAKGVYLVFPVRRFIQTTEIGGQALAKARTQLLAERWIKTKKVVIRPRRFFRTGVRSGLPKVYGALDRAGRRAIYRIFGKEGA